ncbi:hypothetical protein F9K33_09260 [bacterium]|nr:MAG: hypothetical protein F9K33_09260 [bacterium]
MKNLLMLFLIFVIGCNSNPKKDDKTQPGEGASNKTEDVHSGGMSSMQNTQGSEVTFKAPDGWLAEAPNNPMRKAQYRLPGTAGDAEMAAFFFPGAGGSVDANLDRWYGQFKQPDGRQTKDKVVSQIKEVNGLKVTVVYVTGTYLKSRDGSMMGGPVDEMANYALRAAIVETPNGPWFYKAVGPQKTIDGWSKGFDEMVNSFNIVK